MSRDIRLKLMTANSGKNDATHGVAASSWLMENITGPRSYPVQVAAQLAPPHHLLATRPASPTIRSPRSRMLAAATACIGTLSPTAVEGSEDDGRPMRVSVERQRETLIRWRFTPSGVGDKHVHVRFSIPMVTGDDSSSTVNAPWAGIFKVPVERAVYRLLLPDDWPEGTIASRPPSHTRTFVDGLRAVEIEQRPLADTTFGATLQPGVIRNATIAAVRAPSESGNIDSDGTVLQFLANAILVAIAVAVFNARRSKRGSGSGSSSCAGDSSCSSSSCGGGGGCGGGCGG